MLLRLRYPELLELELLLIALGHLDDQPTLLAMKRHLPIADLTEEVDRLARRALQRELQLVFRETSRGDGAARGLRSEEAIRGYQPVDPLMRAKKVVVRDEVMETSAGVLQVLGHGAGPEFTIHRAPEALALS